MNKQQILDSLSVIQSEEAIVKGNFSFDREYASNYACIITNITLCYSTNDSWEAIIYLEEEAKESDDDVVAITQVKRSMSKDALVSALNLLDDDSAPIKAEFQFKDHWGSSYKADILGLKFIFQPDGINAVIEVKEAAKEVEVAA